MLEFVVVLYIFYFSLCLYWVFKFLIYLYMVWVKYYFFNINLVEKIDNKIVFFNSFWIFFVYVRWKIIFLVCKIKFFILLLMMFNDNVLLIFDSIKWVVLVIFDLDWFLFI